VRIECVDRGQGKVVVGWHSMPFKFAGKISKVTIELKPMEAAIAIEADRSFGKSLLSGGVGLTVLAGWSLHVRSRVRRRSADFRRGLHYVFPSELERTSEKLASAVYNENDRGCDRRWPGRFARAYSAH
jgi:hypothetical protein